MRFASHRLARRDLLLLAAFCLILFGYEMFSGRPLSLHEARLPETAREMLRHHNWLFPQSGGRPWLERPPIPHWILIATSFLLGQHVDSVWVVRLPSVMMGTLIVLLTAWMAALWFGRNVGLLSGFVLATMWEFYAYCVLAEDDIFLAATVMLAVAAFVRLEFATAPSPGTPGEGWGEGIVPGEREDPLPLPEYRARGPEGTFPAQRKPDDADPIISSARPHPTLSRSIGRGNTAIAMLASFFGNRPWEVWAFFFLLGLTNVVKSPLVGAVVVLAPVGAFLLWTRDPARIRRYVWFWGWLIFAILLVSWALAAAHYYPDVWRNWKFDYTQTKEFDGPPWYYPMVLAGLCMPWIWASIFGFWGTRKEVLKKGFVGSAMRTDSASGQSAPFGERSITVRTADPTGQDEAGATKFLWCWAILSIAVLSIPHRKHHHYAVPSLAPWAILSAIGLRDIWRGLMNLRGKPINPIIVAAAAAILAAIGLAVFHRKIGVPMPAVIGFAAALVACIGIFALGLSRRSGALAAGACFVGIAFSYCWGQSFMFDLVAEDTAFLHRVEREAPRDEPLYVNSDLNGEMDFFRNQFYLRPGAILLHNLTYLRDEKISAPEVWIVTRHGDLAFLQTLGSVTQADESRYSRRERSRKDRFTLFRLRFRPDLRRYPRPPYIDTLQAMDRAKGPYCGPPS